MSLKHIFTGSFLLGLALSLGCSTPQNQTGPLSNGYKPKSTIPGLPPPPALALVPRAKAFTGEGAAIIQHVIPGSVAEKAQFKPGDQIVKLNGSAILSAAEFDQKIKHAPPHSVITVKRNGQLRATFVTLLPVRPRFGAGFEPEGVALVKSSSPFISFMHMNNLTAFSEASINDSLTDLHLNLILSSAKPLTVAHVRYTVYDRGKRAPIGSGQQQIKGLGSESRLITKAFHQSGGFKGPILVSLEVEGKQFRFEFQ